MLCVKKVAAIAVACLVAPVIAFAQGAVAGVVRDVSGAVLPGVTVEASSPVLIEKIRTAVTDGTGQYKIVDLRPGVYAVTFTLTGFSTVKREGIELSGSFVASVNAELKVGSVEETITVTAETPVVDVQSTTQQRSLGKDIVDAIPSGRLPNSLAVLIPGVTTNTTDVGGTDFGFIAPANSVHGSKAGDSRFTVEGLSPASGEGTGQYSGYLPNMSGTQEVTIDTTASGAEQGQSGLKINLIPREGGNTFKGSFFGAWAGEGLQGTNITDDLKSRGLSAPNKLKYTYDVNPGFGGPIKKDRIWFFVAARWDESQSYVGSAVANANAGNLNAWLYVPDPSKGPFTNGNYFHSFNGRLTWQANAKNKFNVFYDDQTRCSCPWFQPFNASSTLPSPEAATPDYGFPMNRFATLSWSSPVTSRLLLEAGFANHAESWHSAYTTQIDTRMIGVVEQSTGMGYRGVAGPQTIFSLQSYFQQMNNLRAALSYVTGTHALKVGLTDGWASNDRLNSSTNIYGLFYRFNNGVPNQITQTAVPYHTLSNVKAELGVFAQDKWTVRRLTLNLGVRFDYFDHYFPANYLGPGPNVPTRNLQLPAADGTNWKDITPRLNAAYDVFGNGKTAVKVSLNKYLTGVSVTVNGAANPVGRLANSVTRSWNDANKNFTPDCNLLSPAANGECGAMSNVNFGNATPSTTLDPAVFNGWNSRGYNWEFSTSLQQQVITRVSVDFGFFYRSYGNLVVTDNRAVAPSDYSPYSITAPSDSRLPGGGGYAISGLYDLNPNKVGLVDNYQTFASNYGTQLDKWSGFDVTVNARPQRGVLLQGGVSAGRSLTDNCDVVAKLDNPSPLYCRVEQNLLTQAKLIGTYTVPRVDVQVSGTFQSVPGPALTATYAAPAAAVQGLGRPLSAGATNVSVNLVAPQTMFGDRLNQLDLRLGKVFKWGKARAVTSVDIFNTMNANPVLAENSNFAAWRNVQAVLNPRYARLSVQFDF